MFRDTAHQDLIPKDKIVHVSYQTLEGLDDCY